MYAGKNRIIITVLKSIASLYLEVVRQRQARLHHPVARLDLQGELVVANRQL